MENADLRDKVVETATWAMDFISECEEGADAIDSESVARVLDSTSKVLSQINEMDRIEMEAKEKEAARIQQLDIENRKIDLDNRRANQEAHFETLKAKQEKRRTVVEVLKVVGTVLASFLSFYCWENMFKMHKNGDFMTGTEKDAARQAEKVNNVKF